MLYIVLYFAAVCFMCFTFTQQPFRLALHQRSPGFDLPRSRSAMRSLYAHPVSVWDPSGCPLLHSQEMWELGLSVFISRPKAWMWVWKVVCLYRSALRWTGHLSRVNPTSFPMAVPSAPPSGPCNEWMEVEMDDWFWSLLTEKREHLKASAGQKLKIFFQRCGSSAAVKHTAHYESPFCFTNITLSVGQSINLWRRVITALHHQEWRRGKHEGKKEVIPLLH